LREKSYFNKARNLKTKILIKRRNWCFKNWKKKHENAKIERRKL